MAGAVHEQQPAGPSSVTAFPDAATTAEPPRFLLLPRDAVPEEWRERAAAMCLVPLLPDEAAELLRNGTTGPRMSPEEIAVARLAAQGLTVEAIAHRLELSVRSVHRRLARLRQRLGVGSTAELAAALARRGF